MNAVGHLDCTKKYGVGSSLGKRSQKAEGFSANDSKRPAESWKGSARQVLRLEPHQYAKLLVLT